MAGAALVGHSGSQPHLLRAELRLEENHRLVALEEVERDCSERLVAVLATEVDGAAGIASSQTGVKIAGASAEGCTLGLLGGLLLQISGVEVVLEIDQECHDNLYTATQ